MDVELWMGVVPWTMVRWQGFREGMSTESLSPPPLTCSTFQTPAVSLLFTIRYSYISSKSICLESGSTRVLKIIP